MYNRGIKYYSSDDLSCGYYLEKASQVLEEFNETDVNINYQDDFWKLLEKFKLFIRVSGEKIIEVMSYKQFRISDILYFKNLVNIIKKN